MPRDPQLLVDVHAHFVTDDYVAAAKVAGHLLPDGMVSTSAMTARPGPSPGMSTRSVPPWPGSIRDDSGTSRPCRSPMSTGR